MKYIAIVLTILFSFSFIQPQVMIDDDSKYMETDESISENIMSQASNEGDASVFKLAKNFIQPTKEQENTYGESLLTSPIYLLKKLMLLLIIKYNTSFYPQFF